MGSTTSFFKPADPAAPLKRAVDDNAPCGPCLRADRSRNDVHVRPATANTTPRAMNFISGATANNVIPFNNAAAISCFTPHECGECAVGDLFGFVQRLVLGDRVDEVFVFTLIRINIGTLVTPCFARLGFDAADWV
jgi:hypothetical protein